MSISTRNSNLPLQRRFYTRLNRGLTLPHVPPVPLLSLSLSWFQPCALFCCVNQNCISGSESVVYMRINSPSLDTLVTFPKISTRSKTIFIQKISGGWGFGLKITWVARVRGGAGKVERERGCFFKIIFVFSKDEVFKVGYYEVLSPSFLTINF